MKLGPKQRQWLEDLPKYKKTRHALCRRDRFCCLGVYLHTQNDEPWVPFEDGRYGVSIDGQFFRAGLPEDEVIKLGLRNAFGKFKSPILVNGEEYHDLARLNDSDPFRTHAQMAEFIREHKDEIFTRSA